MKLPLLALLLGTMASQVRAQSTEFVFRNDFRPAFEKTITAAELNAIAGNTDTVIIDVRLEEDFAKDPALITGARRLNPEALPNWLTTIDKNKDVVVYCVAGRWVSQKVAYLLDESGVRVRSLEGGIEAWKLHTTNAHQ